MACPFLQIEQVAKEPKRVCLWKQTQPNRASEMRFKDGCRLPEIGQHSRRVGGVLLRFALKRLHLRWLQGEAPMEVDTPEARCSFKEGQAVVCEYLRDRIRVLVLPGKIEPGDDAGVLIQARAFGECSQRTLDGSHSRVKLQIRQAFFVHAGQRKQAPVSAALEGEDIRPDEAGNRNDAARGSSLCKPRRMLQLFSVCAGHSKTSDLG